MKPFINLLASAMLLFTACSPSVPIPPLVRYTNFNNAEVTYQQPLMIDLDSNGKSDFVFTTQLYQQAGFTKMQFRAVSLNVNKLLVNDSNTSIKSLGDKIIKADEATFTWRALTPAVIVEKVFPAGGQPYWEGPWKNIYNKYLAIQLMTDGKIFNGWVRLSFNDNTPDKIIIHDAAISLLPDISIEAGKH